MQAYSPRADPAGWIEKLGERYEVTQTTIKRWTTGGPIQSPLDAMQIILKRHPFEPDQVKQVGRARRHKRGLHGEQPGNAGYLSPAHGRGDDDRQDGFLQGGAR